MKHTFKRFLTITVIAAAAIFTLTACGKAHLFIVTILAISLQLFGLLL